MFICCLNKGEPGLPGLRGPEGAPGRGIPGEKVISASHSAAAVQIL